MTMGYKDMLQVFRSPLKRELDKIMQRADIRAFHTIQRKYAGHSSAKYLDMELWMTKCLRHAMRIDLHKIPPLRILDLGTGPGHFPFICKAWGHEVVGLDLAEDPLFADCLRFFQVQRYVHSIHAFKKIPSVDDRRFDLITALHIIFSSDRKEICWEKEEWSFFLKDLAQNHLKPNGKVFLLLNKNRNGREYYQRTMRFFADRGGRVIGKGIYFESMKYFLK